MSCYDLRMELEGIHHLTAVSSDIKANYRFYTTVLGMRLVKRSVNQDDVSAYHLFYADAVGSPWDRSPVPPEFQIRGLGPIMLSVTKLKRSEPIYTRVMNLRPPGLAQAECITLRLGLPMRTNITPGTIG